MVGQLTDQSIDRKLICKCSNLNLLFFVYIIVNLVFWGFGSDKTRHLKMWKHLLSPLNPVKWYFSSCVLKIWCIPIRSMILFPPMFQNWFSQVMNNTWASVIVLIPQDSQLEHEDTNYHFVPGRNLTCSRNPPWCLQISCFLQPTVEKPQNIQDLIIWNRVRRANLSVWNS